MDQSRVTENYGRLPLAFEANHGQTDARVDFVARTGDSTVFLTPTAAVFAIQNSESRIQHSEFGSTHPEFDRPTQHSALSTQHSSAGVAVHMQIVGANPNAHPTGTNPLPGVVNYFIGNDPNQWHANIPTFGRVEYLDVYPGIDLAYYGNQGQLEYDFIVSPGADPSQIALNFAGADGLEIDPEGNLVMHTAAGDVVQQKPLTYQQEGGSRLEVASRYALNGTSVRFEVGAYDPSRPLVIDPLVLGYSTFLGGSNTDGGTGIAVDGGGSAYLTGYTPSSNFPSTPGAFDTSFTGVQDAFVAKLNPDGTALAYATFLGGSGDDGGSGIAVDGGGSAYLTGYTRSANFPVTPGAFDTIKNGPKDAFVAKLNPDGTALAYATFLGGSAGCFFDFDDSGFGVAVDDGGSAYVTGMTCSTDFPTTPDAFDTSFNGGVDAFVAKLRPDGTALAYATFLGGSGFDAGQGIAVDGGGSAFVTGRTYPPNFPATPGAFDTSDNGGDDAFVTKLRADGAGLLYSTFLGGSDFDRGLAIAVDGGGSAFVTGFAHSADFPTTPGAFDTSFNYGGDGFVDVFVSKLTPDGTALAYSTYLGGDSADFGHGIAVDGGGSAYVTGLTRSADFPVTPGAFDGSHGGWPYDAFVTKLNPGGTALAYSTFLGGSLYDKGFSVAVDGDGNVYVTGQTESANFPTTPGAFDTSYNGGTFDAFMTKFRNVPVTAKGDM